jgi:ADP-dependent NAD(P)H-hydrate dehydratase / NAD(P)H-hydrate epimerase
MKIFSASQIRDCDAYTIHIAGMPSIDLMERAASKCADWLMTHFDADTLFITLCGTGNNGGDGLAITRLLAQRGIGVKAFVVKFAPEYSANCDTNLKRLQLLNPELVEIVEPDTFITDIPRHVVFIDALLGTGVNRPAEGWLSDFIRHINLQPNRKIAIDMPSGLPADSIPPMHDIAIVHADDTLSFQFYKRTFLHPETGIYAGRIHVLDIGLDKKYIADAPSQYQATELSDAQAIYHPRDPFAHKGIYGSVLMVGGSYGKIGAITLSALAAARAGAGLVTALTPACGYDILQTAAPEIMCRTQGVHEINRIDDWDSYKAIGIGPGMGTGSDTAQALAEFIDACKDPIVLDADALNIISRRKELLAKLPPGSILTPHPKEFARLFGDSANSMTQLEQARMQAMRYNINIVLKGHYTAVVTTEGDCHYNLTGNPGMATGGSGDVLTGIITGLLAQGYTPPDAAIFGVYIHGLAGDLAALEVSQEALIAGDIIRYLGKAFLMISGK